jgi:hypothetical protein
MHKLPFFKSILCLLCLPSLLLPFLLRLLLWSLPFMLLLVVLLVVLLIDVSFAGSVDGFITRSWQDALFNEGRSKGGNTIIAEALSWSQETSRSTTLKPI